jgi:hypothetical protein
MPQNTQGEAVNKKTTAGRSGEKKTAGRDNK